jgi:hypothetical protein
MTLCETCCQRRSKIASFLEWAPWAGQGGDIELTGLRAQNIMIFDGLVKIALAKAEAEASDPVRAVAILDEALATADRRASAYSNQNCIALAAISCCGATPPIPRLRKRRS